MVEAFLPLRRWPAERWVWCAALLGLATVVGVAFSRHSHPSAERGTEKATAAESALARGGGGAVPTDADIKRQVAELMSQLRTSAPLGPSDAPRPHSP